MNNRLRRLARNESGMTYVFIGLGFTAFLSASMLAIDVGMLMTARNQAQNAADAGALAGATALLYDNWNDRSAGGPAVTSAIAAATNNKVMAGIVSVNPADVEFPLDPDGQPTRVKVTVRRTAARGNPVSTLIAKYFGTATADIGATATAEVSPANAMTCVKPFTVPDRWQENAVATLGRQRHLRRVRQQGTSARQSGHLHPRRQAGIHRLQPGVDARPGAHHPRRDGNEHHGQLLLLARAR